MGTIQTCIYLLLGCVYCIYDYHKYQKEIYYQLKNSGQLDNSMFCYQLLLIIFFWPLILIGRLVL